MNIRYTTRDINDVITVTVANVQLPLYGCWVDLAITAYSTRGGTAVNFTCKPLADDLRSNDTFDAMTTDRPLQLGRNTNRGRQTFSQHITFPEIRGVILHWSELHGGGVDAGRTLARAILQKSSSMIETIRQGIRFHVSSDVRQLALSLLHERFHKITAGVVTQFLNEIHWRMMFRGAECDDDTMNVIAASLDGRNPLDWFSILHNGDTGILMIDQSEQFQFSRRNLADLLASALLRNVCGETLGNEFDKTGGITICVNDYTFKIRPNQFVDCYDPNNKHARLCIHTLGFQCNPTDEVVFAFLHIKNNFDEYMSTAIYHGPQNGFVRPARKNCTKV